MKFIDLSGQRFGKLTVIGRAPNKNSKTMWYCLCDCGDSTTVSSTHLRSGHTISCGCYKAENMSALFATHRMKDTAIYRMWHNMRARCKYESTDRYKNYGGRGIQVCQEWDESFEAFYQWALSNGYRDGLSIERKDVNGNYCPENCCFILLEDQALNRTTTRYIEHNGIQKPLSVLAKEIGKNSVTLSRRIDKGLSVSDAVSLPLWCRTQKGNNDDG